MEPANGFHNVWFGPLVAAAVVIALAMALLVLFAITSFAKYKLMLEALVPKEVLNEFGKSTQIHNMNNFTGGWAFCVLYVALLN